ncbi:putative duf803 domain membrane protein [Botryosphaeria dothidea]|uniref:Duf803 domain membrane protein n=1 Tax=Botryosphaeria dothidea TaxID=55169 RepID=A0A8H4IM13_9PEZI|nr:putative duf803 domain membrane protein [Botryosphaeria dothidea]
MILPSAAQAPLQNAVADVTLAAATAATTLLPSHSNSSLTPPDNLDAGSGDGNQQNGDWSSLIGITTAIVGNILISFALNTQKYAHLRLAREAEERRRRKNGSTMQDRDAVAKANAKARKILGFKAGDDEHEDDDDADGEPRETDALLSAGRHSYDGGHNEDNDNRRDSDESDAASLEAQARDLRHPGKQTSYLQSPYWWIGIVLMIIGEAGNFLAYGFAPASIVSPLGVVALISNCIIAPIMLKEPFRKRDFLGVLISIGGAVTVVLSANDNNPKLGPHEIWELIKTWEFETYFGITFLVIVGLMWASRRYGKKSIFIDLGLVGLFGGYTALSTKGVASMLSYTLFHALTFPVTYLLVAILVFTAVMQIKYLNRALQRFDATQVIPTQFVLFTLSVILGSAILYRDFERTNGRGAGEFVGGCAMTFLGVWIITTGRPQDDDDEEEEEEERAPEQEDAINLGPEEYGDDEVHYGPTYSSDSSRRQSALMNDLPMMSALTPYASAGSHHRRPSMHRLNTPHITLTSEPPSQAVTVATTPAAMDMEDDDDDALTANPWASDSIMSTLTARNTSANAPPPLLHTTASSPILPSEAEALASENSRPDAAPRRDTSPVASTSTARPSTPPGPPGHHLRRKSLTTPSPSKKHQQTPLRPSETEPATPSSATPRMTPSAAAHLKRGSISGHLVPGPLTSPLSSSLSAVVADSLRKGVEMRSLTGPRPRRNTRDQEGGLPGGFGGWLSGATGVGGVAGPRDVVGGVEGVARRSRGVSQSEGEGVASGAGVRSRSFAAGEGPGGVALIGEGEGEGVTGRARSASNPFGARLRKVKSRGEGVDDGEQQQQEAQEQRETEVETEASRPQGENEESRAE